MMISDVKTTASDYELIAQGMNLFNEDKLMAGIRLFEKVKDQSLFTDEHKDCIRRGRAARQMREDLSEPISEGWSTQGESHGTRDFITYYKVGDGGKLKCRIESVIESSLFIPFLAALNETTLYQTWFPHWKFPFHLGINRSTLLEQRGRCDQVVQLTVDLPFPLRKGEVIFWGFADEDCDDSGTIGAKLLTVDETFSDGKIVPPRVPGIVRMELEADLVFQPCPVDHSALKRSKGKYPDDETLILLRVGMHIDPLISYVPRSFINFCTRTALGTVWRYVLKVSEEIRDGKRIEHTKLIAEKHDELYHWVENRVHRLISTITAD